MKCLFIGFLLLLNISAVSAQSINLSDLINLTQITYKQAKEYLTNEKKFKALPVIDTVGATISQFAKNDQPGVTELVVKSAWLGKHGFGHPFVHYDVTPKAYADVILSQLKSAAFRLISHETDKYKTVFLYENEKFMVSVYTFSEKKMPAAIEIHIK